MRTCAATCPGIASFAQGVLEPDEPTDIRHLWRDDLVSFLLGCSFTFENALIDEGLPVRHITEGRNVPMYRTSIECQPAGRFRGKLVVSMRPYPPEAVERVTRNHGPLSDDARRARCTWAIRAALGIEDLSRPDFGEAVTVGEGEVPVFWACGVTPQVALCQAGCELAITHSPGSMFVTDWRDTDFRNANLHD